MTICIYFGNKPLFLTDQIDTSLEPYLHHDDSVFMDDLSTPGINSMIHEMRQEKVHAGIYLHPNLEELQHALWKKFLLVKAAGGLVLNEKEEVLLIFRRGKWDMPKGKLDPGESLDFCALREVEEETGLGNLQLKEHLITTYHTYDESGKHILKESHWYRILAKGEQVLKPQTEEEITAAKWVPSPELKNYQTETFPSIIQVWQKAGYL